MTTRTLTVTWEEPQPRKDQHDITGRQYIEAVMSGKVPPSPMSQLMGFRFTAVGDGTVSVECTPGEVGVDQRLVVDGGVRCR